LFLELKRARLSETNFAAVNLDTGAPTRAGEYDLADETFRELVRRLERDKFAHTNAELQTAVVSYLTGFRPKLRAPNDSKRWAQDESALSSLKMLTPSRESPGNGQERFDTPPKPQ
jgi:hypothetical protein